MSEPPEPESLEPEEGARPDGSSELPELPSLDEVRAELNIRLGDQDRRSSAFDSRAALIIGSGGVLIGLSSGDPTLLQILGQVAAAAAAAAAGSALWPRVSGSIGIEPLREKYLTMPPEATKLALLDTRIWLYEQDEQRLASKVRRLKVGVGILGVSVVLMLGSGIVEYANDDGASHPRNPVCWADRSHHDQGTQDGRPGKHCPGGAPIAPGRGPDRQR